ncbi:uracil-DNA glycosylase [Mariprofundus erugo]|uniref:uracil-DNA glycosylase n=1 Tax=Mariprofundus erugo TaxID=2528639 RepID=UPI0010FD651C|nr:uracil-DNA glycosylase [Mariprofundus erugo]TLS74261.1 uracil-DNA glycosylase [Mariprofundus erugo]
MKSISPSWDPYLAEELTLPYMQQLADFLATEQLTCPPASMRFEAFQQTPFDQVKVVILGQDPYHGPGQAHGLSFSVPPGIKVPPSLRNIYRELHDDLAIKPAGHGDLTSWAKQGVLLLNTTLTVAAGKAASHQKRGWEPFTDQVIRALNHNREHLVFMLWGSASQAKGKDIDPSRHLILDAPHPSPLSAYRGFFGCRHFSKANHWLQAHHMEPIHWQLPDIAPAHFQQTLHFS